MRKDDTMYIGIDPGFNGTGIAGVHRGKIVLLRTITCPGRMALSMHTWQEPAFRIADKLVRTLGECNPASPQKITLEFPEVWGGSAKSYASATQGHIPILCALCGVIVQALQPTDVQTIFPGEWKGQLAKGASQRRIFAYTTKHRMWSATNPGEMFIKPGKTQYEHEVDAIGIALYGMGVKI